MLDLTEEDIKIHCKTDESNSLIFDEDGNLLYYYTNGIGIPFNKNKLIAYLRNIEKKFIINTEIKYKIYDNLIGGGIKAVSYTHLDVYKRQVLWSVYTVRGCRKVLA